MYTLELFIDPGSPQVPSIHNLSPNGQARLAFAWRHRAAAFLQQEAYVCGTRHLLSVGAAGRTFTCFCRCPGCKGHFLPLSVSVSPNLREWIGSNEGISPPSALRSMASPIEGTTLRRQPTRLGEPMGVERVLAFGVAGPPEHALTRSGGPPSLGHLAHVPAHGAGGCKTAAQRCAERARLVQHAAEIRRLEYPGSSPTEPR